MNSSLFTPGLRWVLVAMTTSLSMVYVDMTVLPVALPTLSQELKFSPLTLQWIINAYTLTLTVLAMGGSKLAHALGLKKAFCSGVTLFAIASALCGMSFTEAEMISARILQGVAAAFMIPSQQAIILTLFPPHVRGKTIGLLIGISSLFLTTGPFIGGFLIEYLSWRYIFWLNLPIALLGLILTLFAVPSFKRKKEPFDWFGFFTLGIGVTSFVLGIMHVQSWGWFSPFTIALLASGAAAVIFLYRSEQQASHPLLDLQVIHKKSFAGGSLCIFCVGLTLMIAVYWTIFFQTVLKYSPLQSGILMLMANAPVFLVAPISGHFVDKFGPRLPVVWGFTLLILALICLTFSIHLDTIWVLIPCLSLFGLGPPLIFTASFTSVMDGIPLEKVGIASGMNLTLRQLSSTIGVALFGTLFYQWHSWAFSHDLSQSPATAKLNPADFEGLLSKNPAALEHFGSLSNSAASLVKANLSASFTSAFYLINLFAILCSFVGIWIACRNLYRARFKS